MGYLDESSTEQDAVFLDALRIFQERNLKYKDTWKQYGALANLVRSAQKIDRLMAVWWHEDTEQGYVSLDVDALDDAYDAINHLAFFIRCAKEGNLTGEAPVRPVSKLERMLHIVEEAKEREAETTE